MDTTLSISHVEDKGLRCKYFYLLFLCHSWFIFIITLHKCVVITCILKPQETVHSIWQMQKAVKEPLESTEDALNYLCTSASHRY